jgi:predicted permease
MNLRKRMLNQLDQEIEEHIALETQDNIDRGMSPEEAHYAALRKFGNVVRAKEETRAVWSVTWLEELLQDMRFGLRTFRKSPGFVAVAILTLALGIGANTAIFSLIDAVMLRALPVDKPSELVLLQWKARNSPHIHGYGSYGDCPADMRFGAKNPSGCSFSEPWLREIQQANIFSGTAAFANSGRLALTGNGPATTVQGQLVSGDFFHTLGLKAAAGRLLVTSDDMPSAAPVIVLNYGYWQSAFGGAHDAVGRTVNLNGVPFTIVGVVESRFTGITPGSDYDLWLPIANDQRIAPSGYFSRPARGSDPGQWWMTIVARLDPAKPLAQAQAVASGLFRNHTLHAAEPLFNSGEAPGGPQQVLHREVTSGPPSQPLGKTPLRMPLPQPGMVAKPLQSPGATLARAVPIGDNPEITLLPAQTGLTGNRAIYSSPLYVLMLAVGIILLIACANVVGLMLARAAARQKEMAVRMALGAGRIRVMRQLLTESVMLSALGGGLGVVLAYWGSHAIVAFVSRNNSDMGGLTAALDLRVLAFTAAVSVASGILFGIAPAFRSARADLAPALKDGEGSSGSPKRHRAKWLSTNNSLVVSQMALAMVLLVGAGLLVRTLQNLRGIDIGFDSHNLVIFSLNPELAGYKGQQVESFYRDLQGRFAETPGVKSASYSMQSLLSGGLMATAFHWPGTPQEQMLQSDVLHVGRNFFETMHIPLLEGRNFTNPDFVLASANSIPGNNAGAPIPVIVNKAFVKKFVGKENPLGKQFGEYAGDKYRPASLGYEIIGVAGDTKYSDLRREINPMMFAPQTAGPASFELRTATDPQALLPAIRKVVAGVNASMPLFDVRTESEQIERILFRERLVARLAGFFSILALVLACIGLYGLLSYEVTRRRREIGIRMALGAQGRDVLHLVIKQGIRLALVGTVIGAGVALGITRYLTSMLYNVRATDPLTVASVAVLLSIVSLAACFIPARRATRVDPMVTLRYE